MKNLLLFALALLMAACEKPFVYDESSGQIIPANANVILHVSQFEHEPFAHTRTATDITQFCTRLNIAVFDSTSTKVKTVAQ